MVPINQASQICTCKGKQCQQGRYGYICHFKFLFTHTDEGRKLRQPSIQTDTMGFLSVFSHWGGITCLEVNVQKAQPLPQLSIHNLLQCGLLCLQTPSSSMLLSACGLKDQQVTSGGGKSYTKVVQHATLKASPIPGSVSTAAHVDIMLAELA